MKHIVWTLLMERTINQYVVDSLLDTVTYFGAAIAKSNGIEGLHLSVPYSSVETGRNTAVDSFMRMTEDGDDDDVLIMMDADHVYPINFLERMASFPKKYGVVGALAFRRGVKNPSPLFFVRNEHGIYGHPIDWEIGKLYQCHMVGTGGIAIKRWVFNKLLEEGYTPPFFRREYTDNTVMHVGEDTIFARICEESGIWHYCDTATEIPHLHIKANTTETWDDWKKEKVYELQRERGSIKTPAIKTMVHV